MCADVSNMESDIWINIYQTYLISNGDSFRLIIPIIFIDNSNLFQNNNTLDSEKIVCIMSQVIHLEWLRMRFPIIHCQIEKVIKS